MDGGGKPLRTWEKVYWGVFVTALAGLLFSRLYQSAPPDPKVVYIAHTAASVHACMTAFTATHPWPSCRVAAALAPAGCNANGHTRLVAFVRHHGVSWGACCACWQIDEEKEARKLERARLVLAGHPFSADDDDPFEGLSPQAGLSSSLHAIAALTHSNLAFVASVLVLRSAQCPA